MLAQLEDQKAATLKLVHDWSPARLNFRPAPASWSANQVFDHLVRVEENILSIARQGIDKPHSIALSDRIGFLFIDRIMRSKFKVKTPKAAAQVLPGDNLEFSAIANHWSAARIELAQFVAQVKPDQLKGGVFRHPVGGWMTFPQVLAFFFAHTRHHSFQLADLAVETSLQPSNS